MVEKIIKSFKNQEKFYATGKRKRSVARVWLSKGKGEILINKKNISEYFYRETYIEQIVQPMSILKIKKDYDVICTVKGGGSTGQSGAITLGISKALCIINPDNRSLLRVKGLITRDSRRVERKKYGRAKARKKFQFSKR
jgi:small subunit ribosomal protein S9